jgi:lysozyme
MVEHLPFWGGYHYAIISQDARAQARAFASNVSAAGAALDRMLPPAIDLEWIYNDGKVPATGPKVTGSQVIDWMYEWDEETRKILGRRSLCYTSIGWWDSIGNPADPITDAYSLWVAHWTTAPAPLIPRTWKKGRWGIWQFSAELGPLAKVPIKGIPGPSVDRDRFSGSLDDMRAYVEASKV